MAEIENDTIVAIATPLGRGSIACVRVSGHDALFVVNKILPNGNIHAFEPRQVRLTWLHGENGRLIDHAQVVIYTKPHSYTGEDVVEIFCHGGNVAPAGIYEALCRHGARPATAGEFTRRAILNHKLDLVQAEAIRDIVEAESEAGLQQFLSHLEGRFSNQVSELRQQLLHACALLELGLDFSEEDVEFADRDQLHGELKHVEAMLVNLTSGYERGQALKDGWKVAIVGKPNVGKSSLMNALLRYDRVIVSALPGTTRDTVEDRIRLGGQLFRMIDTAGIRSHGDEIEQIGIVRSLRAVSEADIILFVVDNSNSADENDREMYQQCLERLRPHARLILVRNKRDLPASPNAFEIVDDETESVFTCAMRADGISELETKMLEVAGQNHQPGVSVQYLNARHKLCLEKALASLRSAQLSLQSNLSAEFVALDLREAAEYLGMLIGEVTTEDVLEEIFANFCIGK